VLFLVNNAMLDPTWAGPVVDDVYNLKFNPSHVVQEGGGIEEAPPPQPNFTMKARSATKFLRQVEAWHGELGREKYVVFQSWDPCGVSGWEVEDETPDLGKVRWIVQELTSSWEMAAEGRAMHHCIVSYSDQCADGNTAVWSICAEKAGSTERENVLTVALDIHSRAVTQAVGRYNAVPNQPPRSAKAQQTGAEWLLQDAQPLQHDSESMDQEGRAQPRLSKADRRVVAVGDDDFRCRLPASQRHVLRTASHWTLSPTM
jgi:hypothetical protein